MGTDRIMASRFVKLLELQRAAAVGAAGALPGLISSSPHVFDLYKSMVDFIFLFLCAFDIGHVIVGHVRGWLLFLHFF